MELRAFAESVLFGTRLEEKLHAPLRFSDERPGSAITTPNAPGRPQAMALVSPKSIPASPTPTSIEDESNRGVALHTFAHHELQALELMALALLKFPDAPPGFRRGLAKIITDEQRHFRLYQARAEHWGVGLGDTGVGHFFWDTVADIQTPSRFLAALSLTYEQANLDFAVYWKAAFSAIEDHDTVDVLQQVYEDEVTHVRHGRVWFERLHGGCDFESYATALTFPLSPGRAKGPVFNRQGRVQAGFPESFIDELEIRNVSRGRPPRVFTFDPFIEEHIAGRTVPQRMRFVQHDLACLPMFLARREDVVIAKRPRVLTLRRLHQMGLEIPQFCTSEDELGDRERGEDRPWGTEQHPELFNKLWALQLRRGFASAHPSEMLVVPQGVHCSNIAEAKNFIGECFIAKAPLSASGQHRVRLDHDNAASWLKRHLQQGPILIEPWHNRIVDLSVQVEVEESGPTVLGITRFWTTPTGSYKGAFIGPWTRGLSPAIARAVHGGSGKGVVQDLLNKAGLFIGDQAHSAGFRGALGIDAMLVSTEDGPRLQPILEVNPRTTMGRIALSIAKRTTRQGGWFFVGDKEIAAAGHADRTAFISAVESTPGVVFTTEPMQAKSILTVMSLAHTWQEAMESWTTLGFPIPALHS